VFHPEVDCLLKRSFPHNVGSRVDRCPPRSSVHWRRTWWRIVVRDLMCDMEHVTCDMWHMTYDMWHFSTDVARDVNLTSQGAGNCPTRDYIMNQQY
jgi:hypothetical protein